MRQREEAQEVLPREAGVKGRGAAIRGPIVAPCVVIMVPDATKQTSITIEVELEISEEEERVNDELLEHPTRDDLHEQRERGQKCEGVIHAHCHPLVRCGGKP